MQTTQYKEMFISESQEILAELNKCLVDLEKDPTNKEKLNTIFRGAHTIKGMAGTMEYDPIVKLTHAMESALDLFRLQSQQVDKGVISQLFEALDSLEVMVECVQKDRAIDIDVTPLVQKFESVLEKNKKEDIKQVQKILDPSSHQIRGHQAITQITPQDYEIILSQKQKGFQAYQITISLAEDCSMIIARQFIALKTLEGLGEVIRSAEIAEAIKQGQYDQSFTLIFLTQKNAHDIKNQIKSLPDVDDVFLTIVEPQKGDLSATKPSHEVQFARVSLDRLDSLMNVVGELAINKIRINQLAQTMGDKAFIEAAAHMARITNELQNQMMQIRLLPLEYLFNRFPRVVRDMAAQEGKEVDLEIEGANIGVDRAILDDVNDPLIHLIRNAVFHGIETPEERKKKGKNPRGKMKLIARQERNFVLIELHDDGAGIDPVHIRKVAVARNIISEEEASKLSDQEALMLITVPGLSTSKQVTETAGRGVGMNVVKSKVETIGGTLSIQSQPGQGSRFILKLPLSMAIIQAMLVGLNKETFAIPLVNIAETIKVKSDFIKRMEHQEIISYRDGVLPLVRLNERLGFGNLSTDRRPTNNESIVVVDLGFKKAGLIVDSFIGQQEIVIKSLAGGLKKVKGLSGATILGSGRVAMILDVGSII